MEAVSKGRFVSGHDFSRAVSATKSARPLGPEGSSSGVRIKSKSFSAACLAPVGISIWQNVLDQSSLMGNIKSQELANRCVAGNGRDQISAIICKVLKNKKGEGLRWGWQRSAER